MQIEHMENKEYIMENKQQRYRNFRHTVHTYVKINLRNK